MYIVRQFSTAKDSRTFSAERPDAVLAANRGASGGSFGLTVTGLTDSSVAMALSRDNVRNYAHIEGQPLGW